MHFDKHFVCTSLGAIIFLSFFFFLFFRFLFSFFLFFFFYYLYLISLLYKWLACYNV